MRELFPKIRALATAISYDRLQHIHGIVVSHFDYMAPAELYAARGRSGLGYRRFPRAAEAIRYAIEKLPANLLAGSRLEVEEQHYDGKQIRDLYESENYPLPRNVTSS